MGFTTLARARGYFWAWSALLLLGSGCASIPKAYAPASANHAAYGATGGINFMIPPSYPRGELDVRSFGVIQLRAPSPGENEEQTTRAIHVRVIAVNRSRSETWHLNVDHLMVAMNRQGSSRPDYVNYARNGPDENLPVLLIGPGDARTLDLYYRLPHSLQSAGTIPSFAFSWDVTLIRGKKSQTVFNVVSFSPFAFESNPPELAVGMPGPESGAGRSWQLGWGSSWWSNPYPVYWSASNPAPSLGVDPVGPSSVNVAPLQQAKLVESVRAALQADPLIHSSDLRIYSRQPGTVMLGGRVLSEKQHERAIRIASSTPGVRHVIDRIRIGPPVADPDIALVSRIYDRIDEDPSIGTDALIDVSSLSGRVRLNGIVESWKEADQAAHDAFAAGARSVISRIHVRNSPELSERARYYAKDPRYS